MANMEETWNLSVEDCSGQGFTAYRQVIDCEQVSAGLCPSEQPLTIASIYKHRPVVTQRWKKTNKRHRCPYVDPLARTAEVSISTHGYTARHILFRVPASGR